LKGRRARGLAWRTCIEVKFAKQPSEGETAIAFDGDGGVRLHSPVSGRHNQTITGKQFAGLH
jgi:hypothetical protein